MLAPTPPYRGPCATTPKRPRPALGACVPRPPRIGACVPQPPKMATPPGACAHQAGRAERTTVRSRTTPRTGTTMWRLDAGLAGYAAPQARGPGRLEVGVRPPARDPDHAGRDQLEPVEQARHTRPVAHRGLLRHGLVEPPHHLGLLLCVDVAAHVRDHQVAAGYARRRQPADCVAGLRVVADEGEARAQE